MSNPPFGITFEHYRDAAKKWRWRLISSNNRIIADSAQSYSRLPGATRASRMVYQQIKNNAVFFSNKED